MPQTQKSMCGWDPSHPSVARTDADLKPGIHSAVPGLLALWENCSDVFGHISKMTALLRKVTKVQGLLSQQFCDQR